MYIYMQAANDVLHAHGKQLAKENGLLLEKISLLEAAVEDAHTQRTNADARFAAAAADLAAVTASLTSTQANLSATTAALAAFQDSALVAFHADYSAAVAAAAKQLVAYQTSVHEKKFKKIAAGVLFLVFSGRVQLI